jgi:hypothetical protein
MATGLPEEIQVSLASFNSVGRDRRLFSARPVFQRSQKCVTDREFIYLLPSTQLWSTASFEPSAHHSFSPFRCDGNRPSLNCALRPQHTSDRSPLCFASIRQSGLPAISTTTFHNLIWIFRGNGLTNSTFLGDSVDRRQLSREYIWLLYALALKPLGQINLLCSNHEVREVASLYEFRSAILSCECL